MSRSRMVAAALALAASLSWSTAVAAAGATYALVVGVGKYADASFTELKADLDAEAFAETLRALGTEHVSLLTNERATRQEIGMWFIRVAPQPGDTIYIYLAGHGGGIADRSGREAEIGAFFPYDAQSVRVGWSRDVAVEETVITEHDLSTWTLEGLRDCDVVVFIDACKSALIARSEPELEPTRAIRGEGAFVPRGLVSAVRDPSDRGRMFVFASSSEYELSFEDPTPGRVPHGLFTRCLLKGLVCDADTDGDGYVTFRELADQLTESMLTLSRSQRRPGMLQTPVAVCDDVRPENEFFRIAATSCDLAGRWPDEFAFEDDAEPLTASGTDADEIDVVEFVDRGLERFVRQLLELTWETPITRAGCEQIRVLSVPNKGIASLQGVEAMVNLEYVDVRWNTITDLTPLLEIASLEHLGISANQILDAAALWGKRAQTRVEVFPDLGSSQVDDATAILWLTEFESKAMSADKMEWIDELMDLYDPDAAGERVSGTIEYEPAPGTLVYPGVTYTFTAHVRLVVTELPVVQIARFVTERDCYRKYDCWRAIFAEKFEPGEHTFTLRTDYEIPLDAEPGRIIWYAFDLELAPHNGWVVGEP